jgi:hypothetical protein
MLMFQPFMNGSDDETVWMGLGLSICHFIAQFTPSSVKLHLLLREVDFCRDLRNVRVFHI